MLSVLELIITMSCRSSPVTVIHGNEDYSNYNLYFPCTFVLVVMSVSWYWPKVAAMCSVNGQPAAVCSTHSHSWRVCAVNLLSLERFSISAPFRSCLTLCCVTVIDSALRTLINPSGGWGEVSEAAVSFGTTRSVFESLSFSCCIFKGGKKIQRNSDKSCYWLKCVCLDICLVQDKLGYKVKTLQ